MTNRIVDEIIGITVTELGALADQGLDGFQKIFLEFDVVDRI